MFTVAFCVTRSQCLKQYQLTLDMSRSLLRRHNERDGVSNHQRLNCLLNRLFRGGSKKHQSSVSLAFVRGIHQWPVNSLHKGPVTRKMFPFEWRHHVFTLYQNIGKLKGGWIEYVPYITVEYNRIRILNKVRQNLFRLWAHKRHP